MLPPDFRPPIFEEEEVSSTNSRLKDMALHGAGEGTVLIAKRQSQGRGSGEREWLSPEGGLYLSVLLSPRAGRRVTDLSLVAGIAVAQTIKNLLPKSSEVSLKWPNDCLVGWKKISGILSESLGEAFFNLTVVGIGINVNLTSQQLAPFQGRPFGATSFLIEGGGEPYEPNQVRDTLLKKLFSVYDVYHHGGFQPIQYLWERNCAMVGKRIELRESAVRAQSGSDIPGGAAVGTLLGIDDFGGLVLSNAKGERRSYFSGEIACFWP